MIGKRLRRDVVAGLGGSLINTAGLLLILWLHFSGRLTLSETAAASGAFLIMGPRLNELVMALGLFHENALFIEDFWSFLELGPPQNVSGSPQGGPTGLTRWLLEMSPSPIHKHAAPALNSVSIDIRTGETVALVGKNGAGKTTVAKLLCGFYRPQAGSITWDGHDLTECSPDDLRSRIAAIFQDFAHYQLSARENIGFGNVSAIDDAPRIVEAARKAGADGYLERLPQGYETLLGRHFEGGHELSIGEWQRVALARAFFREAPLVIMDEPIASLDARSEFELFQAMRFLFAGRAPVDLASVLKRAHGRSHLRP